MTTLVEFMITASADNRPPMLEKSTYDSWKSRMELYMENMEHGKMILNSFQNGPLVCPTIVQEDGTTRTKKYEELLVTDMLQANYDLKATTIVFQGLPPDMYAIINHHKVAKEIWDRVKLLMQGTKLSLQEREYSSLAGLVLLKEMIQLHVSTRQWLSCQLKVPVQQVQGRQGQSYACNANKGYATNSGGNNAGGQVRVVKYYNCQNPGIPDGQAAQTTFLNNVVFQTEDLDAYDSDCDDVFNAKAVLMANLSNYGLDVILEVPHSESYHNDFDIQSVHAMQDFKQTPVVDFPDNEMTSDSNIIPYS
nr:hypothetical protein [Tanacetum cinerariifolium]